MTPHELPAPYAGPPLRLAFVGNQRHPWCSEVHFTKSLESLGHNVTFFQEDETDWTKLPAFVAQHGIQAIFWTRTWPAEMTVVEPVLKELAAMGCPTISYHLDKWFSLSRAHQVDDQPFFRTSLVVSPDDSPHWAEHGVNHFWLPPGVYGPECEPVPPNPRRWPWDVVFVGSHPYPHPEWQKYRTDLLSAFRAAFGRRFAILPRERRGTPIRGRDLQELYATVPVVLGDSCLAGESHRYWSDRVPETLGRGGLLIHPSPPGMGDWYSDETFMSYVLGDFVGAVDLARWAMNDREMAGAITDHGKATVLARDTYAHRMGTVLAVAEGIYGGYREVVQRRPVSVAEAVAAMPAEAMLHVSPIVAAELRYPQKSVHLHDFSAIFHPRPDTTDAEVVQEVWGTNDYRVPIEGFSGTVIDIGGNIGAFSVLAAKAGAKVVRSFEPQEDNLRRLLHHRELNRLTGQITAHPEAVTDGSSEVVHMAGSGGGARHVYQTSGDPYGGAPTTTLRHILSTFGPVEFLKCDIEGGEYEAFVACPVELLARVDRMSIELHGPGMPHLTHLNADGKHLERWGALVAKLADAGRVELFGHPMRGGLCWWTRY